MIIDGISDIFRRVLETDDIGPESDFFAAGGDSLLATRVLSAVAREYGVELSFDDFLLAPTPDTLAKRLANGEPLPDGQSVAGTTVTIGQPIVAGQPIASGAPIASGQP